MKTLEATRRARNFARGLQRWDQWLRKRLAPAMVSLADFPDLGGAGCRWTVEPPFGNPSTIRIPPCLIEVGPEDFHRTTIGLGSYYWEGVFQHVGEPGLKLVCAEGSIPERPGDERILEEIL